MVVEVAGVHMSGGGLAVALLWPVSLLVLLSVRLAAPVGAGLHMLMSHLEPRGGHSGRVITYDWRYRDGAGHDVTDQVHHAGMVVDLAEAVEPGTGTVLMKVRRRPEGWQMTEHGGHLAEQVDADTFVKIYGSPYDAMDAAARHLGMTARES